ncbi:hypothetical protein JIN85_19875 [Luteolibacter pohnpeiensis]|uniref:Uncharacterized protein n=1 Tax=Luteolibacter pohnpeiensis TaxID=454153 RepID=A0A934S7U0_9BACT|nr:hypothetical protein [Luteolibacter pohnpeiensis]MBK1884680.1 hypothetical protein [Luteolibacter pohnpeiensis]
MTIQKIIGENGPMNELCKGGTCPTAIITDGGDAYVQGYVLGAGEREHLKAPTGEDFIRIPIATLKKIAAQVVEA